MRRRAFTLLEILATFLIIAILSGLVLSVIGGPKRQAEKQGCASNLRQIWLAVELYRNDTGNASEAGSLAEMGLPSDPGLLNVSSSLWNACHGEAKDPQVLPLNYQWLAGIAGSQIEQRQWIPVTNAVHEHAVLMADWRHNELAVLTAEHFPKFGLGIAVDGESRKRTAPGTVPSLRWWLTIPQSK